MADKTKSVEANITDDLQHPGMMGDGTEEQNLNQKGKPENRITEEDVKTAFEKDPQNKSAG